MKKGFTLAELLGVIVIIGIIVVITVPIVTTTINNSKEAAYEKQVNIIEMAAKQWGVENVDELPDENITKKISISTLVNSGKIQDSVVIDPRTDGKMKGCVVVSYNTEYNQYEYKYSEDESLCQQKICTYKGTDSSKKYEYGAEYECELGDGVTRTFYVLEYQSQLQEVSLIMNKNLGDTVAWNTNGSLTDGPVTAEQYLINQTSGWAKLDEVTGRVSLPSVAQLARVAGVNSTSFSAALPSWLTDYLSGSTNPTDVYAYWTSSVFDDKNNIAVDWTEFTYDPSYYYLGYVMCVMSHVYQPTSGMPWAIDGYGGVRPVITLSESNI